MPRRFAVILAGGKGERFWPLSTVAKPKQLLSLVGDTPLLSQAVDRLRGLVAAEDTFIITNQDLVVGCRAAAPSLPPGNVIGEPVGRDTAAAVALAAALVKARDPNGSFAILTADHVIGDMDVFTRTLAAGFDVAERCKMLVTIGIQPNEPSTAFGYIEAGDTMEPSCGVEFMRVRRFVEKPDRKRAEEYLQSGRFFWNAGMFVWTLESIQQAFAQFRPVLARLIDVLSVVVDKKEFTTTLAAEFPLLDKISIDYAVMEKAPNIAVARAAFRWDDVGSWTALEHHFKADEAGNVFIGDAVSHDAVGNIVCSRGRMTALVGVRDLIVVQADGVTLVCAKERAQDIKKLIERIRQSGKHLETL